MKFVGLLAFAALISWQAKAQFPISPNAFDANGHRTGHWTVLYDSSWHETQNKDSAFHYRLVRFEAGKPTGKVRDFFRNGIKQWDGYLLSVNPDVQDGEVNYYYENGKIHYAYLTKAGKMDGYYKEYRPDGILLVEGEAKNDSLIGRWIYYNPDGIKFSESIKKYNKNNGPVLSYFPSGKIQKKGFKVNDSTEGWWDEFYESGQLKSHEHFHKGTFHGAAVTYFENGQVESKGQYLNDNKIGAWEFYHENGQLSKTGVYDSSGFMTGTWKHYFANGNTNIITGRKAGKFHGSYEDFYESGKTKTKGVCDMDRWQGVLLEYYENGQLKKNISYSLDSLDGHCVYYYENGKVSSEGNYVNNKKTGTWKYFREDGSIESEEEVSLGILNGKAINYYSNGNIETKRNYVNGIENGIFESFYESGMKKTIGKRINGKREGDWLWYFENGNMDSKEPYAGGLWQGNFVRYFSNANKRTEGEAVNDMEEGPKKIYFQHGPLKGEGNMHLNKRHGHWVFYDSLTGKKESEGEYVNGKLNGKWIFPFGKEKLDKYAIYIHDFKENFSNVEDSLKKLSDQGYSEKATHALKWLDRVRQRDFGNDKVKKLQVLFWKGYVASGQKKYQLAASYYSEYLQRAKKILGDTAQGYYDGVNNYAVILDKLGKSEEAYQLVRSLDNTYIKDRETPNEITHYENVAFMLGKLGRWDEKEKYILGVLEKRKKSIKATAPNTLDLLYTLGNYYLNDKMQYGKSISVFKSLISLADSLSLQSDENYGIAHYRIGVAYRSLYDREHSLVWLKKAAQIQEKDYKKYPNYILNTLNTLGNMYMGLQQVDSSFITYSRMKKIVEEVGYQNTLKYAIALDGLAEVYYINYEYEKALELWMEAKTKIEDLDLTDSYEYRDVLQPLSLVLPSVYPSRVTEAEGYLTLAVELELKAEGESWKYRDLLASLGEFYTKHGFYEKAKTVLEKDLKLLATAEGETSPKYAACLNYLGENEYQQDHFRSSIAYHTRALAILENNKKADLNEYLNTLSDIGWCYNKLNETKPAEEYMNKALSASKELVGSESISTINKLEDLASVLSYQGLYSESEKATKEAIALAKKMLGENNLKYAYAINNLALLYRESGNYRKALAEYKNYNGLIKKIKGENSFQFANSLENIARVHNYMDQPQESEKSFLEAIRITEKIYGKAHIEYAWKLKSLGDFYNEREQYALSIKYLTDAATIAQKLGESSTDYANFLVSLAKAKTSTDELKEAEQLLLKSVAINKKNMGDRFGSYISSGEQLVEFYELFGRHQDALNQLNELLPVIANKWGKETRYIEDLITKSNIFYQLENYDSARSYANNALKLAEDKLAPSNWRVLKIHDQLGIISLKELKLSEASSHFNYTIEQQKLTGLENSVTHATTLHNLALVNIENREFATAEKLLKQSQEIDVKQNNKNGLNYIDLSFGKLYNASGKPDLAEKYFRIALTNRREAITHNFYFLSDNEKALFWKANRFVIDYFQSFAIQRMKTNPSIIGDLFNLQLNTKGILLSTSNKIKKRILSSRDSMMINRYYQWLSQRDQLAQFYTLGKEDQKLQKPKIDSLETIAKTNEKELNISSEDLEKDKGKEISWRDVQKALAKNEAAIEIIRIKHHTAHPTDSTLYAALVLTSEMKSGPQAVVMPNGKLLENRGLRFYKNAIVSQLTDTISYHLYWAAIEKLIKNKSRLYLSLDGVYNSINLNTLRTPEGNFLVDTKNISIVSNTKDLLYLKKKTNAFNHTSASLIGFPRYFLGKEKLKKRASQQRDIDFSKISDEDRSGIAELPGTKTEIEKIDNILLAHKWNVKMYTDENASEESIKEIRQPALLHIATHGFFVDEKDNSSWMSSSDPMLRAGLLFTGAANFLQDKINVTDDNGILTAYEAANLNLDNTELVILSACETGKGEVQNGEGVYGLQRAFQTAGAKSILMSLWKVDDTATQELMTLFYQNWTSGKTKSEAFKQAQLSLKEKYLNPYYWGAFVMMGE